MAKPTLLFIFLALATTSLINLSTAHNSDWNVLRWRKSGNDAVVGDSLKTYCESWRINVELNNIRGFEVVPEECVDHIRKYMTSSQYAADSERAVEQIVLYLAGGCCCSSSLSGRDAWIFDVDDTLISTIPYHKKHGWGGAKMNSSSLEAWMEERKAPALEHSLTLFKEMKDRAIKIFLVSSTRETLRSATVDNLIKVGYHGWSNLFLRGLQDESMEVHQYKRQVRQKLVEEGGYQIWGIVGDQWSSFEGLPNAERTFKLPNSLYYLS